MSWLFCMFLAVAAVEKAEQDIAAIFAVDVPYTRYLYLDNIEEKEREHHLSVVSFILNTLSTKKKITKPVFVDKEKTVIRFDLRDYEIEPKNYDTISRDPYVRKADKLKAITKSENPIMRTDWFIVKAMVAPTYYKLMGVSSLKDFKKRHNAEQTKGEQAAVVLSSNVARKTRYIKRSVSLTGPVWEARDSATTDYFRDLLSDKYDSVQLLAFNPNGLISYYAADNKDNAHDYLSPEIAMDKAFEPDLLVRVARNCVVCHVSGVMPVDDAVRSLLSHKDIKLMAIDKNKANRLSELFSQELPIKKDQQLYEYALLKATDMDTKTFAQKFVAIHKTYYADLTLEQAAKEIGSTPDDFKKECLDSGNPRLVRLAFEGKISRVQFEQALEAK